MCGFYDPLSDTRISIGKLATHGSSIHLATKVLIRELFSTSSGWRMLRSCPWRRWAVPVLPVVPLDHILHRDAALSWAGPPLKHEVGAGASSRAGHGRWPVPPALLAWSTDHSTAPLELSPHAWGSPQQLPPH